MKLEVTALYERDGETAENSLTIDLEDPEAEFTVHKEGGLSFTEYIAGQEVMTLYVPEHRLIEVTTEEVEDDE